MPERFPSKVRDPADNNDPHKIGRREPRAEYLGWLHCRQINEIVDHRAWMSSQARFPRRLSPPDSSVFSKLLSCTVATARQQARGGGGVLAARPAHSVFWGIGC